MELNEPKMIPLIHDAILAGFRKIVLIIKPADLELVRRLCGDRIAQTPAPDGSAVEVVYAFQDFSSIPEFYAVPEGRTKPFGTTHALLCTKDYVDSPFAVVNADDYYGPEAYRTVYEALLKLPPEGEALMVIYKLKNTISPEGTVTRGICEVEDGILRSVTETYKIKYCEDGVIRDMKSETDGVVLDPDSGVSLNFWGFMPSVYAEAEDYFNSFLKSLPEGEMRAECLLPSMVDSLVKSGVLKVRVL